MCIHRIQQCNHKPTYFIHIRKLYHTIYYYIIKSVNLHLYNLDYFLFKRVHFFSFSPNFPSMSVRVIWSCFWSELSAVRGTWKYMKYEKSERRPQMLRCSPISQTALIISRHFGFLYVAQSNVWRETANTRSSRRYIIITNSFMMEIIHRFVRKMV